MQVNEVGMIPTIRTDKYTGLLQINNVTLHQKKKSLGHSTIEAWGTACLISTIIAVRELGLRLIWCGLIVLAWGEHGVYQRFARFELNFWVEPW